MNVIHAEIRAAMWKLCVCVFRTMSWHWNTSRRPQSRVGWTDSSSWAPCITVSVRSLECVSAHDTPLFLSYFLQSWLILPLCCLTGEFCHQSWWFCKNNFSHSPEFCLSFLICSFPGSLLFFFCLIHCHSPYPPLLASQMALGWSVITSRLLNSSTWPLSQATSWPSTTWPRCTPPVPGWCAPATLLLRWATLLLLCLCPVKLEKLREFLSFYGAVTHMLKLMCLYVIAT